MTLVLSITGGESDANTHQGYQEKMPGVLR